jgi:hypothetical protein
VRQLILHSNPDLGQRRHYLLFWVISVSHSRPFETPSARLAK